MTYKKFPIITKFVRDDKYNSPYFDKQISNRYLLRLSDSNTIEVAAYQHFLGKDLVPIDLATDNGAMIAWQGVLEHKSRKKVQKDFKVKPDWRTDQVDVIW